MIGQETPLNSMSVTSNVAVPLTVTTLEPDAVTLGVETANPLMSAAATAPAMFARATEMKPLTLFGVAAGVSPLARNAAYLASINGSQLAASIGAFGPTVRSL